VRAASINTACCSAAFSPAMNRIVGRLIAAQIACASAAIVLLICHIAAAAAPPRAPMPAALAPNNAPLRLQCDLRRLQLGKELNHLLAPKLLAQHRSFGRIHPMQHENTFARVHSNADPDGSLD
jgi:hypothetical protein